MWLVQVVLVMLLEGTSSPPYTAVRLDRRKYAQAVRTTSTVTVRGIWSSSP